MRVSIQFDGASTDQVRQMTAALSRAGLREALSVGCDGAMLWSGHTDKLTPNQFASVVARLIKVDEQTIADFVNERK